jgi:tRNA(Ile)-lysidine synthase
VRLSPPSDLSVAKFTSAVQKLAGGNARLLLAVSGGPDSLAMLLLAHAAIPDRVCAATVDHGLRPEAAYEATLVAALCSQLSIPHSTLRPHTPITGNLQSSARTARYALLQAQADATGCDCIATAHHADDQLETVLMRIARGSGIDGLSGVRALQGRVIRPMLAFTKTQVEAICAETGVAPVRDPSNKDDSFDRVKMRQWLAANPHPFDPHRTVRTATALGDAAAALDWMTDALFQTHVTCDDGSFIVNANDLPRELQRRLVLRILSQIQSDYVPRGDTLDRALETLADGGKQLLGDVQCEGGKCWRFRPAPQRRH